MKEFDFETIINDAKSKIGKINVLIAGQTGVGKSTLLNAVFGEDLAETGKGAPCTQNIMEYSRENSKLHLFDTKGLELRDTQELMNSIINLIDSRKTTDPTNHIHIAWYCISEESERLQEGEINFIKQLSEKITTIVVFTKAHRKELYDIFKQKYYSSFPNVVRTMAVPMHEEDENGSMDYKSFGIDNLVTKTYELLPDVAKNAFAAAQQVDNQLKHDAVKKVILAATSAAAATGATPIPFADAAILAPIQIGMIAEISHLMGLSLADGALKTIVGSAIGVSGAVLAGKTIVSGLLKCFPGAGTLLGSTISGSVAGILTTTMGWAYYHAIEKLQESGKPINPTELATVFVDNMKKSKEL